MSSYTQDEIDAARQESLGRLLLNAHRAYMSAFTEQLRAYIDDDRINASLVNIMIHISAEGVRVADIAESTHMTRQSASQFVNELEVMGYVEKTPDPRDGRAALVHLSAEGLEIMRYALEVKKKLENAVVENLADEGFGTLVHSLKTVHELFAKNLV